jgi:uncharacterized membrane protein
MLLLATGLVLFLGVHLVPTAPALRASLLARLGPRGYRGSFALASAAGLALVIAGYWLAGAGPRLFPPSALAARAAPLAITLAFILFATSHAPSHLRRAVRHPMLLGLLLWSLVHLFANGDARGTLLFGAFAAFAVVDLVSVFRRRQPAPAFVPRWRADIVTVVAGVVLALAVMAFHRVLFGPRVVPWGY